MVQYKYVLVFSAMKLRKKTKTGLTVKWNSHRVHIS